MRKVKNPTKVQERNKLRIWHKKAWDKMSEFVRKRDKGICYTCGKANWDEELGEFTIKGMQGGHFRHGVLDFDPENIHCQCPQCNKWLSGNLAIYAVNLLNELGEKRFIALNERADQALKGEIRSVEDYQLLIHQLEYKISRL